ncbi:hypothetical protein [Yersinia mollaretii]|uniref:hypothetical protein n=1 Tax=Yersinia mollaretii TaxID=33060 RepID=UPI001643F045|nr:hypothetical protein [Yersinia mollaretii]
MNVNYKHLFISILLFMLSPTVIADPLFSNRYVKNYSNCSAKLLDDNSVEVSFQANMVDTGKQEDPPVPLSRHDALLSLYFYHADGSPNTAIQLSDISHLTLNGSSPKSVNNSVQEIRFNFKDSTPVNERHYSVSFIVSPNALKSIRIGATVGRIVTTYATNNNKKYPLLSSKGVSFSPTGHQCQPFDPQSGIAPQPLKVDPKFRLTSGVWQLKTLDLDYLLEALAAHRKLTTARGLHVLLANPTASRFCLSYRSIGIENTRYMIKASNRNGLSANNKHFQLKAATGNNTINYQVRMKNAQNREVNFELPKEQKFIKLRNNNHDTEQMCWSPKIRFYGTDTTIDKGSYSDTLNFTITPEA